MIPFAPLPKTRDEQVEWFHNLTRTVGNGTPNAATAELVAQLADFVAQHLPGHTLPPAPTEAEFVESVHTLRESERSWNQALMNAIIEANDRAKLGSPQEAAKDLRAFASQCPWALFAEVATRQAHSLSG
jgi:hypothetical protein